MIACNHEINKYNHYNDNNKQHKEKYIEKSIKKYEKNTNAKVKVVNNPLNFQTNTNKKT